MPSGTHAVLDVGCGLGSFARKLAQRAVVVDAIDADRTIVTEAERHNGMANIHYARVDFLDSNMPQASYHTQANQ
ncbi:MAG: methyltransferase domain-containing protein [Phormidesmis sp. RL_2_1]|nr:methyltransferase domain-containing protein [Phormidesmis sp. RL_2_1]